MFGKRYPLFTIFGFRVGFDLSWLVLAAIVVWTLAETVLPQVLPGRPVYLFYLIAGAAAAGLFASIIFHEMAHALVARGYGIRTNAITLFVFGGVAELEDEPHTPGAEFMIAVAGPISSYLLAGAFHLARLGFDTALSDESYTLLTYLMVINLMLATFNLIPAFPLDGGRMLRALIWWLRGSPDKATGIAATLGMVLGVALMAYGGYGIISDGSFGAAWEVLIGYFIVLAARDARSQAEALAILGGVTVGELMKPPPGALPGHLPVREIVAHPELRENGAYFPVAEAGQLIGVVQPSALAALEGAALDEPVRRFARPLPADATLTPDQTGRTALARLRRWRAGPALVIAGDGRIVGWLGPAELFGYLDRQRQERKAGAA